MGRTGGSPGEGVEWFTVAEVAKRLRVRPKTVYAWINADEVDAIRLGPQSTRIRASEVERIEREGIEW